MMERPQVRATALGLTLALAANAPVPLLGAEKAPREDPPPETASSAGTESQEGAPDEPDRSARPADGSQPANASLPDDGGGDPASGPDDEAGSAEEDSTPGVNFGDDWSVRSFEIGVGFNGLGLNLGGMQTEEGDWSELVERSDALRGAAEVPGKANAEASRDAEGSNQDAGDEGPPDEEGAEGEPDPGSTDG